jgi:Amt family ammonium transporter
MPAASVSGVDAPVVLVMALVFLVPCAAAGLALINTGLGRSRSAAHCMMAALCVIGIAALAYFVCGFAWQGFAGVPSHVALVGGKPWSWLGAGPFLFRHLALDGSPVSLAALLGIFSVGLAALIPLGSGSERWRLGACCASTAVLAGWTYPLFAHWAWGGGWLAQLGTNYGLGAGFIDCGGAGSIQALGGLTALSIAWLLGARHGKYPHGGLPAAIPGHNGVLVMLGCIFSLTGWLGLNSAGAILYYGLNPGQAVRVAINTILCAATAALTAAVVTRVRFGKPDASLTANGWIGGLAASSGACAFVHPAEGATIGLIAGMLVTFSVEWFELQMSVDDPGGSVSAHAMGGLWGLLAAGIFARIPVIGESGAPANSAGGQWLAQLIGIATLIGFVLPLTYGLNWIIDRLSPQRVAAEGERQGMDLFELGAGAYPEFIVHSDDIIER